MIVFLILAILILIPFIIISQLKKKKYVKFVRENSVTLKELILLNKKYHFDYFPPEKICHTYDNEDFFYNISCKDYLIYQLQFETRKYLQRMSIAKNNRINYGNYCEKLSKISKVGTFSVPYGKYKLSKLLKIEKGILSKTILRPTCKFAINVVLYRSKINGSICEKKSKCFNENEILSLIKRFNNKNGRFYNDREIWDALCRVERGRVSNALRFSIYKRDGYRCCYCGISERFARLEIDHIVPIAKGGKSVYNNLQTLCHRCNVAKGDSLVNYSNHH